MNQQRINKGKRTKSNKRTGTAGSRAKKRLKHGIGKGQSGRTRRNRNKKTYE